MNQNRKLYALGAFFSAAGLVGSFWQLLDKLTLLKHPGANLSCNLNSVFDCGRVLTSHQYEVFGFPNAIIALVMFTFFLTFSLAGLGGRLTKQFTLSALGLALFMLGFINWFVFESIFRIHAMCLFCTVVGPSILIITALLLRLNQPYMSKWVQKAMSRGADIFVWILMLVFWVSMTAIKLG